VQTETTQKKIFLKSTKEPFLDAFYPLVGF